MRRGRTVALLAITLLTVSCRPAPPEDAAFEALLDAERQFAAATAEFGMKVAFLRYLHDDSIIFRPHPVDGKSFVARGEDPEIDLSWSPSDAGLAGSEDLGWTTGPFHVEAVPDRQLPATDGFFVSIWRRLPNRRWKVLVDLGVETPAACEPATAESLPTWSPPPQASPTDSSKLEALEQAFIRLSADEGATRAYAEYLTPDGHLYRDGLCPLTPEQAGPASPTGWTPGEFVLADSSDLGFARGRYRTDGGDEGYYVRIWRLIDDRWRIAVDITSPLPAGESAR